MTAIVIATPAEVVGSLRALADAVAAPIVLVGGWAVASRLRMARSEARPTEDIDVLLTRGARPAAEALRAIEAVQDDPEHHCRLRGLPLLVDLLAEGPAHPVAAVDADEEWVEDDDGLRLLIPPMDLLPALATERAQLLRLMEAMGSSALLTQARLSGYTPDPHVVAAALAGLGRALAARERDER